MWDLFLFDMKIKDLKNQFETELENSFSKNELQFLFPIFMEEILLISQDDLRFKDFEWVAGSKEKWESSISELKKGIPYQYVLGSTVFYGMKIKVNENTLIPRPETEELLDFISKDGLGIPGSIADFGCGSGCISLALKKIFPPSIVHAYDISSAALEIANQNSTDANLPVEFAILDLLNHENLNKTFDLIVSNPPYVRELEKKEMSNGVLDFEPHLALFVKDTDALIFYAALERIGQQCLNENGTMYFEINQYLAMETKSLFGNKGWETELIRDMSGNWRFLKVWK